MDNSLMLVGNQQLLEYQQISLPRFVVTVLTFLYMMRSEVGQILLLQQFKDVLYVKYKVLIEEFQYLEVLVVIKAQNQLALKRYITIQRAIKYYLLDTSGHRIQVLLIQDSLFHISYNLLILSIWIIEVFVIQRNTRRY